MIETVVQSCQERVSSDPLNPKIGAAQAGLEKCFASCRCYIGNVIHPQGRVLLLGNPCDAFIKSKTGVAMEFNGYSIFDDLSLHLFSIIVYSFGPQLFEISTRDSCQYQTTNEHQTVGAKWSPVDFHFAP